MILAILHHIGWLVAHGYVHRAALELRQLLAENREHPRILAEIHRYMYSIHPDWGI